MNFNLVYVCVGRKYGGVGRSSFGCGTLFKEWEIILDQGPFLYVPP